MDKLSNTVVALQKQLPQVKPAWRSYEEFKAFHELEAGKYCHQLEQERHERRIRHLMHKAGVPPLHQTSNFLNYEVCNGEQAKALETAKRFAEKFDELRYSGKHIVLSGDTGTGKTHLAAAITNALVSQGNSCLMLRVVDLMSSFREAYGQGRELRWLDELKFVDLLILDEVGASHNTKDEQVQLSRVIDDRTNHCRPVIVISNLNSEGLHDYLGPRIWDRLSGNGVLVKCYWPSYRQQKAG